VRAVSEREYPVSSIPLSRHIQIDYSGYMGWHRANHLKLVCPPGARGVNLCLLLKDFLAFLVRGLLFLGAVVIGAVVIGSHQR
jgi:hypothetical protein